MPALACAAHGSSRKFAGIMQVCAPQAIGARNVICCFHPARRTYYRIYSSASVGSEPVAARKISVNPPMTI
jgi:hypothetical protein